MTEQEWITGWRRLAYLAYLDDPTAEEDYERHKLEAALVQEGIDRYADSEAT